MAWDVFCGYMMFEYRGGSTSFEKLLESPRVSTDFLVDLQNYYQNERLSVLLVIQAIFGYASEADHKYNVSVRKWDFTKLFCILFLIAYTIQMYFCIFSIFSNLSATG